MTDRTLDNTDPSAEHQDPGELNDQQEITRDAPNVPGADPVRFPSKSDAEDQSPPATGTTAHQER